MRGRAWFVVALLVVSAGCVGGEGESVDTTGSEEAALPSPVHDERRVEPAADPIGSTQGSPCETDAASCHRYPFSVDAPARIQAQLDWNNATNDLDLHVLGSDGDPVASANTGPLDTQETLDAALEPGSYELAVVTWLATSDTYRLEAHFGYA